MHSFALWPTLIVVAIAAATDLYSRRIPNWLVLPFLLLGFGVSTWQHGLHGFGQSAAGMGLGLLIYGVMFWMGGMGAGDVKLCAAIGAWIGPHQFFIALILTSLIGGLMALGWAVWAGFLGDLLKGTGDLAFGWRKQATATAGETISSGVDIAEPEVAKVGLLKRKMPYAPAIAIGTMLSFLAH